MWNRSEIAKMVDKDIKGEKIDVRGCDISWGRLEMRLPYCSPERLAFQFADRWARLMQATLKSAKMDYLTPELIANSMQRAAVNNHHITNDIYQKATKFLIEHWIHGVELGNKIGFDPNIIYEWRLACQNNQKMPETGNNSSEKKETSSADHFDDTRKKTSPDSNCFYSKEGASDFFKDKVTSNFFKDKVASNFFKQNYGRQRG